MNKPDDRPEELEQTSQLASSPLNVTAEGGHLFSGLQALVWITNHECDSFQATELLSCTGTSLRSLRLTASHDPGILIHCMASLQFRLRTLHLDLHIRDPFAELGALHYILANQIDLQVVGLVLNVGWNSSWNVKSPNIIPIVTLLSERSQLKAFRLETVPYVALHLDGPSNDVAFFPALEDLRCTAILPSDILRRLSTSKPTLLSASYQCESQVVQDAIRATSPHTKLEKLQINVADSSDVPQPHNTLCCMTPCIFLQVLDVNLRGPISWGDDDVHSLVSVLPRLISFRILAYGSDIQTPTLRALISITQSCPSIEEIAMVFDATKGLELDIPSPHTRLRKIDPLSHDKIEDAGAVAFFFRRLTNVEKLKVVVYGLYGTLWHRVKECFGVEGQPVNLMPVSASGVLIGSFSEL